MISVEQELKIKYSENKGMKCLENKDQDFPKILYHYTSIDGLMGIVSSRKIWASNIRYLNDKDEFTHTIKKLEEESKRIFKGRTKDRFKKTLFDFFRGSDILENFDSYVFSLSKKGDLLSQWRGYCPNYGVSIGFDFAELENLKSKLTTCFLLPCCYNDDPDYCVELMEETFDSLIGLKSQNDTTCEKKNIENILQEHTERVITVATRFKSNSFSEEIEWRFFHFRKSNNTSEDVKFRKGNSMIIPYIEFNIENEYGNTPIRKIIIGPAPHQELLKKSVEKLLKSNKISCPVRKSKIPFRKL